jgi:hypothetical protein
MKAWGLGINILQFFITNMIFFMVTSYNFWSSNIWTRIRIDLKCKNRGIYRYFFSSYTSTLLHLPPLRFHCVGGAGIEPRTVATLARSARSQET